MAIELTTVAGQPAVLIEDAKGEVRTYTFSIIREAGWWQLVLTCINPQTGEPAVGRAGQSRTYTVSEAGGRWWCQCHDWVYRRRCGQKGFCKHIREGKEMRALLDAMGGGGGGTAA